MLSGLEALKSKYKLNEESESYLQQRLEKTGRLLNTGASVEEARKEHEEVYVRYAGDIDFEGDVKDFRVPSPTIHGEIDPHPTTNTGILNFVTLLFQCLKYKTREVVVRFEENCM